MSNLGLRIAMAENDITVMQTRVGDRYVLEAMNEGGYSLGGEQSGHLVIAEHATTGDGILTGIQLLGEMAATGRSLHELASVMTVYPQVMINVRGVDRDGVQNDAVLANAVAEAEAAMGLVGHGGGHEFGRAGTTAGGGAMGKRGLRAAGAGGVGIAVEPHGVPLLRRAPRRPPRLPRLRRRSHPLSHPYTPLCFLLYISILP
jgi:phosphomannomutase